MVNPSANADFPFRTFVRTRAPAMDLRMTSAKVRQETRIISGGECAFTPRARITMRQSPARLATATFNRPISATQKPLQQGRIDRRFYRTYTQPLDAHCVELRVITALSLPHVLNQTL